jgi:SOS-response transcriptional repressor LexA
MDSNNLDDLPTWQAQIPKIKGHKISETLAKNIQYLMDFNGVKSPSALARLTKISQPTLYRWMVSDAREPRHSSLKPLADFFNVTIADLLERDLATGDTVAIKAFVTARREVPMMRISPDELTLEECDPTDTVPAMKIKATRAMFAITVKGDSMKPFLPDGSVVIIDPKRALTGDKNMTIVLAREPKTQTLVLRRLVKEGGRWYLLPENTAYGTDILVDVPDVVGTVVEAQIITTFGT